jgi:FeS assembly SUF system protein
MSELNPETPLRIWPPPTPAPSLPGAAGEAPPPLGAPLRERVVHALRKVYDPEIPVNIYDLGLIYKLDIDEPARRVRVEMTLTTPNCPEAESLPMYAQQQVELLPEVDSADVRIVWDPPWDKSRMTEEAKLVLGID